MRTLHRRSSSFRRLAVILMLAVAVASGAVGDVAAEHEDETGKSFLWRAVLKDRTVYILGSIHFMKPDTYPLSPAIEDAYASSGLLVFETDIEGLARAATSLMEAGTLEGETTLADVISDELYADAAERLKDVGMSIDSYRKTRPWMLALILTSVELMKAGYTGSDGIDATFSARGERDGKDRLGLESIEFQVSMFADLSAEEGADFLRYTLGDLDSMIPMVDDFVSAWNRGDVARIEEFLVDGFDDYEAIFDRFVIQRNHRWMTVIEELFRGEDDAMVVVGALHLVGEHGLIELLRAKGYEVEQL